MKKPPTAKTRTPQRSKQASRPATRSIGPIEGKYAVQTLIELTLYNRFSLIRAALVPYSKVNLNFRNVTLCFKTHDAIKGAESARATKSTDTKGKEKPSP